MKLKIALSGSIGIFIFLVYVLTGLPIAYAVEANEPLPPEALHVMKKGLMAVEQQEWNLAVRYFNEGRKYAPLAPELLFNMGLAESKLPSREMRSIAWFKAYLAMEPKTANVQAVQNMIDRLNIKAEGTIMKLVDRSRQLSMLFPDDYKRKGAQVSIGVILAKIGDFQGARQSSELAPSNGIDDIVVALAENGDIASAKEILSRMDSKETIYRCSAASKIASIQADSGDISGAMSTVDTCTDDAGFRKYEGLIAIAKAMHKAGRMEEAKNILIRARDNTQKSISKYDASYVGQAQACIGDIKGALETEAMIQDTSWKGFVFDAISAKINEFVKAGELKKALAVAELLPNNQLKNSFGQARDYKKDLLGEIYKADFEAKVKAGDFAGAKDSAAKMPSGDPKNKAYEALTLQAIKENDLLKAELFYDVIEAGANKVNVAKAIADIYKKTGKLAEARVILRNCSKSCKQASYTYWYDMYYLSDKQSSIGDLEGATETALSIGDENYKANALSTVVKAMLANNDIEGAKITIAAMPAGQYYTDTAYSDLARCYLGKGNSAEAQSLIGALSKLDRKESLYREFADEYAKRGMVTEALEFAAKISKEEDRVSTLVSIARYQQEFGYLNTKERTLRQAKEIIASIADPFRRAKLWRSFAGSFYYQFSDVAAMRDALAESSRSLSAVKDPEQLLDEYDNAYNEARNAGLYAEMKQTMLWGALLQIPKVKPENRKNKLYYIAVDFVNVTDLGTAKYIADIQDNDYLYSRIAEKKIGMGLFSEAVEDLSYVNNSKDSPYSMMAKALAAQGDIQGAIKKAELIKDTNSSNYDDAVGAIAQAYFKSGNIAEAGRYALKLTNGIRPWELTDKLVEKKELPLLKKIIANLKNQYGIDYAYQNLAAALAKEGDLAGAKDAVKTIVDESYRRSACVAIAASGHPDTALEMAELLNKDSNKADCLIYIAHTFFKAKNIGKAEEILARVKSEYPWLYKASIISIAGYLAEAGLAKKAEDALLEIHPLDAEFETWKNYILLQDKTKLNPSPLKEQYFINKVSSENVYEEVVKDAALISDPLNRSYALYQCTRTSLEKNNLKDGVQAAALISDEGYRSIVLEELLIRAALTRNLPIIEKAMLLIPDGAVKGQIVATALDNMVTADKQIYAAFHAQTTKTALTAMPVGIAKVKACGTIFRTATLTKNNVIAADAKAMGETTLAGLSEDDKNLMEYMSSVKTGAKKIPPEKAEAERKELEKRQEKTKKWTNLLEWTGEYWMNQPLFTDLQSYIQSLNSKSTSDEIFSGFIGAAGKMADMLIKFKRIDKGLE